MKYLKWTLGLAAVIAIALASAVRAQTLATPSINEFYAAGDLVALAAPTVTLPMSSAKLKSARFGADVSLIYWQTIHTGTGVSLGKTDLSQATTAFLDRTEVLALYRVVPATSGFWGRFCFVGLTGAEKSLITGSSGVEIGGMTEVAVSRSWRLTARISQHFETAAAESGSSVSAGISRRF